MGDAESIRKRLVSTFDRDDLTIETLVAEAAELLGVLTPKQSRYKVAERPDARTIRYYVTQKLLPPPVSYEGGRARYSGSHLARLLWIKRLQSEHHTLKRIATVLETATDEDVLHELFPAAKRRRPTVRSRVKPERLVSLDDAPATEIFERRSLGHGVSLDLPQRVLSNPRLTDEVALRLESLARELRERTTEENKGEDS